RAQGSSWRMASSGGWHVVEKQRLTARWSGPARRWPLLPGRWRMGISQTDQDEFIAFLLEAKRATYAGQADEATVTPLVPGSKQLEYRDGDYLRWETTSWPMK